MEGRTKYLLFLLTALILSAKTYATDTTQVAVQFKSGDYTLHGKLVLPKKDQKVPAVVFLTGPGATSSYRTDYKAWAEENLEGLLLPEGIAILYFDKRGVSPSEGEWFKASFDDRAADAKAAIDFLKKHAAIDSTQIGVIGHSHGGWIAQLVVNRYPKDAAFGISLAGAPFGVKKQLINDYKSELLCKQIDPAEAQKMAERKANNTLKLCAVSTKEDMKQLKLIRDFDPAADIQNIKNPFLFLFAENDDLVNPEWSVKDLKAIFPGGVPTHITYNIIPEANHSFRRIPMCYDEVWEDIPYSEEYQQTFKTWVINTLQNKQLAVE